jgi:phospholipid-translocating ATPase
MWANTFLAIGKAVGLVIYTGKHTRSVMNSREPRTKVGRLDEELNFLSIVCFVIMVALAVLLVFARGID